MTKIPRLVTERLLLRAPVHDDFLAYAALLQSDRASFMGGPFDKKSAWGMFCSDIAQWQLFGHGCLMLELPQDRKCIGQVGINHGPLFPEKELGWLLYDGYEGKGYALEAALAMRNWAFAICKLPTLVSYVDPLNTRSIALAERMGAVRDPHAQGQDPDDLVFRHIPPETSG